MFTYSQEKKKVRFDNKSIKYKYNVEGIIDSSCYTLKDEKLKDSSMSSNPSDEKKPNIKQQPKTRETNQPKMREQSFPYNPDRKPREKERENLLDKFENAK